MADFFEFATDDDAYAGGGFNEALDELMEEAAPVSIHAPAGGATGHRT